MRTYASHGTGKGRSFARAISLLELMSVLVFVALAPGCGDSAVQNSDASPSGDAGTDAWVDLGPIDCEGDPPTVDASCIRGQVYDFGTDQPINVPSEVDVVMVTSAWFGDESVLPGLTSARVRQDGKFGTWQVSDTRRNRTDILYLLDDVPGYLSGAVNVFFYYLSRYDSWAPRLYLVSEELLEHWTITYEGAADISSFRPFMLGRVGHGNYEPLEGHYEWTWGPGGPGWFEQEGLFYEATTLSEDRRSFGTDYRAWQGTSPPSGSLMLVVDHEDLGGPGLRFSSMYYEPVGFQGPLEQSYVQSGAISYLVIHFNDWWDMGQ